MSACENDQAELETSPTSSTPARPQEVELGETITLVQDVNGPRKVNLTIEDISVSDQCHQGRNNYTETTEDGGFYIQMTGEMEAIEGDGYSLSETWMKGTTNEGYAVQFSPAFSCEDPSTAMEGYQPFDTSIIAGQKARGVLEFWATDLPETITLTEPYEPVDYVWKVPEPVLSGEAQAEPTAVEENAAPVANATPTAQVAPVTPQSPAATPPDQVIGYTGAPSVDSPHVLDKTIESCGDISLHQTGTTFFTDGTSGWTETCSQQMLQ
nr:hypothetical protein [Corynebacterium callunae]